MNYVYTRSSPACPWCDRVKALLDAYKIPYNIIDISNEDYYNDFIYQGFQSVPQVFLNNKHIGGFEATAKYLRGE